MAFSSSLFDSTQISLEIDAAAQAQAWQASQRFATRLSQWNAYINELCLQTVLPWLEEDSIAIPYPSSRVLSSIWEMVNGTAILLQPEHRTAAAQKLVVIPTEAIDQDEFLIPQEWVDIPEWMGDYYLLTQVDPDERALTIQGFVTHHQLKQRSHYIPDDRAYSLDESSLNTDMSTFWVAQTLSMAEPTRAEVPPLPALSIAQAQQLIQRLGNAELLEPRLAIPFATWGALMSHGGWRQRLAEQRRGIAESRSLRDWLQAGVSNLAQQWGWQQVNYQFSFNAARGSTEAAGETALLRPIQVADGMYTLQVIPIDLESNSWRFELRNQIPGALIPTGLVLRLLTEDLQGFENNQAVATAPTEQLYLEVALEPGEGLVWEVEPTPAEYDREVLRF